jgi:hypothetical protein
MCRTLNFVFGSCVHFVLPLLRLTGMGQHFCCGLLDGWQFTQELPGRSPIMQCNGRDSLYIPSGQYRSSWRFIPPANYDSRAQLRRQACASFAPRPEVASRSPKVCLAKTSSDQEIG